jgi:hypothetical protein
MTITPQSLASILRQVGAIAAVVMGVLTAALSGIHLPAAASTALTVAGALILGIEHYVSDPSTGTTPAKVSSVVAAAPVPPPAAVPAAAVPAAPVGQPGV